MLTFTTLASGSSGNAALVSCGNTHVLLDAGISAKRITAGLKSLGIAPEALAAVLITHEHHDHISGLQVLTKRFRLPVVTSGPTGRQLCYRVPFMDDLIRQQEPGTGIQLGDLWIESFPTPHDAAGSVGYSITGGGHRVVLCTDLGYVTDQVKQAVRGCDLLVCEANHDEDWVRSRFQLFFTGLHPFFCARRAPCTWSTKGICLSFITCCQHYTGKKNNFHCKFFLKISFIF